MRSSTARTTHGSSNSSRTRSATTRRRKPHPRGVERLPAPLRPPPRDGRGTRGPVVRHRTTKDRRLVRGPQPVPRPAGDDDLYEQLTQAAKICPDRIGFADLRIDLKQSVARLAPRQHEPLALLYIDGLDRETIAELMGLTVEGVKKLLGTAVRTLRTSPDPTGSTSSTATLIVSTDSPTSSVNGPATSSRGAALHGWRRCGVAAGRQATGDAGRNGGDDCGHSRAPARDRVHLADGVGVLRCEQ